MISISGSSFSVVRNGRNKSSLVGCFDDYYQILELFPPFWRKKFWNDTPLRSLSLINGQGWRNQGEKDVYLSKGQNKREQIQKQKPLEVPQYLNCFRTPRQGCFIVVGLSTDNVALVSLRTGRNSSAIWRNVSPSRLRGRIGKSLCTSSEGELGGCWKGWLEGGKCLKRLDL